MAFCTNCGTFIDNDSKFCPNCGAKVAAEGGNAAETAKEEVKETVNEGAAAAQEYVENVQETVGNATVIKSETIQYSPETGYGYINDNANVQPAGNKSAKTFAGLGLGFGITAFVTGLIPIFGIFGVFLGIPGIVFSCIGKKKASDESVKKKAKTGLGFSIAGVIIGFIMYIVGIILLAAGAFAVYGDLDFSSIYNLL